MADIVFLTLPTSDNVTPTEDGPAQKRTREPLWRHMLGDFLRDQRHERGETLDDVAHRAGMSPQYLSEIERGRKEASSEMIQAMAGALDLTLVDVTSGVAQRLSEIQRGPSVQLSAHSQAFALAA